MNTGISDRVIGEIRDLARKYEVDKVILFGSRARGDFHKTSDIDLAVSGGNKVRFSLDVDEKTYTLLEYDVVDLDRGAQNELLESIKKRELFYMKKYDNFCASLNKNRFPESNFKNSLSGRYDK